MKPRLRKITINAPTKKLSSNWTFEDAQDVVSMHGFDAEQEIADMLALDIQLEIDWEILIGLGVGKDWIEIRYSDAAMAAGLKTIKQWCSDKFSVGFYAFTNRIMIAKEEHAVMFMLRWA